MRELLQCSNRLLGLCARTSMGAQKSVHAGKAKIDFNVDFMHKLCAALMLPPFRNTGGPLSMIIGSLCIKHSDLSGGSDKLDVSWDKGLYDSNIALVYRTPNPKWLAQKPFVIQHSLSPELGVHGMPMDDFSAAGSVGVNLSRFSVGLDLNEPASSSWSSRASIKFEHIRPVTDDGRSINRDLDGFPITWSGNPYDNMIVLRQESRLEKQNDHRFSHFTVQIEQGIPVPGLSTWPIFNRFKFVASNGVKFGPALLLTSLTGGSIVGDMAPYQAFSIGGFGSVRGYGEGAVGTGRSCLVANSELTFPLNKMLDAAVFLDCGTDMGSARHVPGNPALRHGKPGSGVGLGYILRFKSPIGHFQFVHAINSFHKISYHWCSGEVAS